MDDPYIPNDESVWNRVGSLIDIEDMRDAIRKAADVNEISPWHSHTPLHLATLLDQTEIISLLMKSGGNPELTNDWGHIALNCARNPHAVETLVSHGADIEARNGHGHTPLQHALSNCNQDYWTDAHWDNDYSRDAIVESLLKNGAQCSGASLIMAIYNAPHFVESLIDGGADVNWSGQVNGHTALHAAAKADRPEVVKTLLMHGADINAREHDEVKPISNTRDGSECEAILMAAHSKQDLEQSMDGISKAWKPSDCKEDLNTQGQDAASQQKQRRLM